MPTLTERALKALRNAEAELRTLLTEAAKEGDYAAVLQLTSWARAVRDIAGASSPKMVQAPVVRTAVPRTEAVRGGIAVPKLINNKSQRYPSFLRMGDDLVLLAWSKRDKAEYRHKASRNVLRGLIAAVVEVGADGRVFTAEELFPIREAGREVPNYKGYVGLSFLKQYGVIEQHGRRGYSICVQGDLNEAVEKLWSKLPVSK